MARPLFELDEDKYLELFLLGAWFRWPIDEEITDLRCFTTVHHVMGIILHLLGYSQPGRIMGAASRNIRFQTRFRRFAERVDCYTTREGRLAQIRDSKALFLHQADSSRDTNWRGVLWGNRIYLTQAGAKKAATLENTYAERGISYGDYMDREVELIEQFRLMDPDKRAAIIARFRQHTRELLGESVSLPDKP